MVQVFIDVDKRQHAEARRHLAGVRNGMGRATGQTIKRTTTTVRAAFVTAVHADLNVQKSKLYTPGKRRGRPIRQSLTRQGSYVSAGKIEVVGDVSKGGVIASEKSRVGRLPIAKGRFEPTQLKRSGVKYKIERSGKRQKIGDAFMAKFDSGFEPVVKRVGPKRRSRRGRFEQALAVLYGPSVPHVALRRPKIRQMLRGGAAAEFGKQFNHQVAFLVSKGRARSA